MTQRLSLVGFDADDTLWHNERFFRITQDRFADLLRDYADPDHLAERLLEAETRNIGHYGYGIKGFVLSMIETAIEVTEERVRASIIAELMDAGREMLAHPIEDGDFEKLDPAEFMAEWKWDGIRVQLVRDGGEARLYSRTGDDISSAFPDVIAGFPANAAIDGELLVFDPECTDRFAVRPFNDLQKRLNRKSVSTKLLKSNPAFVRAYDVL